MKLSHFQFELPNILLAQRPAPDRDESRLMVLNRKEETIEHHTFKEVINFFDEGDVMVQAGLKIGNADTAEILAQRLLAIEHLLYPAVLRALHSERMTVSFTPGGVDCLWQDRSDLPRIGQADICLIKTP